MPIHLHSFIVIDQKFVLPNWLLKQGLRSFLESLGDIVRFNFLFQNVVHDRLLVSKWPQLQKSVLAIFLPEEDDDEVLDGYESSKYCR